jgi:hypothetical protein
MKKDWIEFKKAVKTLRKNSVTYHKWETWHTIRINTERSCYYLNPFRINLKDGSYGTEFDLMSGKDGFVPNLKRLIELGVEE